MGKALTPGLVPRGLRGSENGGCQRSSVFSPALTRSAVKGAETAQGTRHEESSSGEVL